MPVAGSIVANVVARTGSFEAGMSRVNKSMSVLGKQADILAGKFIKWGVAAGAAFAAMALKMASDIEDVEMRIVAITGSTSTAKKIMEDMAKLGPITPFETQELRSAAATLVTFGIEAEAVGSTMEMLSDIASISSVSIEELAIKFGKVRGEGIAFQETLNQLSARQIPIIDKLKEKLGMTGAGGDRAFRKFVEEGKVSFALFAEVMQDMTKEGQAFFEGSEKAANTLTGAISTLMSNVKALGEEIGNNLRPIATKIVKKLNEWVIVNKDLIIQTLKHAAKFAAWAMTVAVTAKAIGTLLRVGGTLLKFYKNLRTAQITFLTLSGPAGWKVLAMAGVIGVASYLAVEAAVDAASVAMEAHNGAVEETREALDAIDADAYKTPEQIAREAEKRAKAAKKIAEEKLRIEKQHAKELERMVIAVETPLEKYTRLVRELQKVWLRGNMTLETYRRTVQKYAQDLNGATKEQNSLADSSRRWLSPMAISGTTSGTSSFLKGQALGKDVHLQKLANNLAREQLNQLEQIATNTSQPPVQLGTGVI